MNNRSVFELKYFPLIIIQQPYKYDLSITVFKSKTLLCYNCTMEKKLILSVSWTKIGEFRVHSLFLIVFPLHAIWRLALHLGLPDLWPVGTQHCPPRLLLQVCVWGWVGGGERGHISLGSCVCMCHIWTNYTCIILHCVSCTQVLPWQVYCNLRWYSL